MVEREHLRLFRTGASGAQVVYQVDVLLRQVVDVPNGYAQGVPVLRADPNVSHADRLNGLIEIPESFVVIAPHHRTESKRESLAPQLLALLDSNLFFLVRVEGTLHSEGLLPQAKGKVRPNVRFPQVV